MASWMHDQAVRCGPLVPAALIFGASLGGDADAPKGPEGLIALARALERHLSSSPAGMPAQDAEDAERTFVELSGAYLALLLSDALGEVHHTVRNARHGLVLANGAFFDPFAAIERVLQADAVRPALAEEVARCELRARDG